MEMLGSVTPVIIELQHVRKLIALIRLRAHGAVRKVGEVPEVRECFCDSAQKFLPRKGNSQLPTTHGMNTGQDRLTWFGNFAMGSDRAGPR